MRDALNGAIKKLQADGTYAKLSQKWFGHGHPGAP
ncbi:hypothetical protein CTI14_42315 [Methylobacterium radiotolerans]|nr:hypothetical protein CTI14_42315 [Methylobacterium radiotolerans]